MSNKDPRIIKEAISFARKFGFLTQEIFFEFLCERGRTQKYDNWNSLIGDGYFNPSQKNPKLLYFTKKGFAAAGPSCVKRRYFYYIDHDTIAAKILLHLEKSDRVLRSWSEAELRAAPWEAISVVGASDATKLPDLVVDLQGTEGFVRIAFEIEASRKSRERYDQISFAYYGMKRVNLVVFVCENSALEKQIKRSFDSSLFKDAGKSPVTMLIDDLQQNWLSTLSRFKGRELIFRDLISTAIKADLTPRTNTPNEPRTAVRNRKIEKKGLVV
jgi:hypothetical protein